MIPNAGLIIGVAGFVIGLVIAGVWKKKDMGGLMALIFFVLAIGSYANPSLGEAFNPFLGMSTQSIGATGVTPTSVGCTEHYDIGTVNVKTQIAGSNAMTTASGDALFYTSGTNPEDATATALLDISVSSGVGNSSSSSGLETCRYYRVIYDGGSSYYDIDYGEVFFDYPQSFDGSSLDKTVWISENSEWKSENIHTVATIGSVLQDDVSTLGNDASEVTNTSTVITYNETAGDGQFVIRHTIEWTGANTFLRCPVLGYEFDLSNPPEKNEISAITVQRHTGYDFGIPADLTTEWQNEQPVVLGQGFMEAGKSAEYDFTYSVTEANLDTNDDFYFYLDDLCAPREKEVGLDAKATINRIQYDDTT